jgi:predicted transcriptional regulator
VGEEAWEPEVAMAHVRIRLDGFGLTRFWPGGRGLLSPQSVNGLLYQNLKYEGIALPNILPRKQVCLGSFLMPSRIQVEPGSSRWLRKRSDIDIMASILNEAHRGARKTHIMYRCNLSHRQLQAYLKLLLGMEFLACQSDLFKTTVKGRKFVDAYRTLKALMT